MTALRSNLKRLSHCSLLAVLPSCAYNYPPNSATSQGEYIQSQPLGEIPEDGCVSIDVLGISTTGLREHGAWWLSIAVRIVGEAGTAETASEIIGVIGTETEQYFVLFDRDGALLKPMTGAELQRVSGSKHYTPTPGRGNWRQSLDERHVALLCWYAIPMKRKPKPGEYAVYSMTETIKARFSSRNIAECIKVSEDPFQTTLLLPMEWE